jgi:hypothetical protein
VTSNTLVQMPFDTEQRRQAYIKFLNQNSDNVALSNVVDSTAVSIFTPGTPTIPPQTAPPTFTPTDSGGGGGNSNDNSFILSLPAIIGIACGGGALIVLFIIYCFYCRSGGAGDDKRSKKGSNSSSTPPMTVSVNRSDDVSTLRDHKYANGHGDQR